MELRSSSFRVPCSLFNLVEDCVIPAEAEFSQRDLVKTPVFTILEKKQ